MVFRLGGVILIGDGDERNGLLECQLHAYIYGSCAVQKTCAEFKNLAGLMTATRHSRGLGWVIVSRIKMKTRRIEKGSTMILTSSRASSNDCCSEVCQYHYLSTRLDIKLFSWRIR